jgi:hypothetical protein
VLSFFLSLGRKGGQASSEDLFPLGYGEWDRIKVRVKTEIPGPKHPGNNFAFLSVFLVFNF